MSIYNINIFKRFLIATIITMVSVSFFINIVEACDRMQEIDNISENAEINHNGHLTVKGNIEKNAVLNITNGKLTVNGNIENNVIINISGDVPPVEFESIDGDSSDKNDSESHHSNNSNVQSKITINGTVIKNDIVNNTENGNSNSIIVNSSSTNNNAKTSITINGKTIVGDVPLGITVHGDVADNVSMISKNGDITIRNSGDSLNAKSSASIKAKNIGKNANLSADNNIRLDNVKYGGKYHAKNNFIAKTIGKDVVINADRVTVFKCLDKSAKITSKNKIGGYAGHKPSDNCH